MPKLRKFCAVYPEIWISRMFLKMTSDEKLVAIHLRTSPHFQMVGIFYQPLALVAKHTGLEHDFVETVVAELENLDYLAYDHDLEVVWVKDMATSQVNGQRALSESQRKGVMNELTRLYEDNFPFVEEWIDLHGAKLGIELDNLYYVQ